MKKLTFSVVRYLSLNNGIISCSGSSGARVAAFALLLFICSSLAPLHAGKALGASQEQPSIAKDTATVLFDNEECGPVSVGSLSVGKFYRFSRAPLSASPDAGASKWSDGEKLTDESILKDEDPAAITDCVAWDSGRDLDVIIDLGHPQRLERTECTFLVGNNKEKELNSVGPESVEVYVKFQNDWLSCSKMGLKLANKEGQLAKKVSIKCDPITGRYVKIHFAANRALADTLFVIRKLELFGQIKNSWKKVPSNGCLHGAYPSMKGFPAEAPPSSPANRGLDIETYEKKVGKPLAIVLAYQGMRPGRSFTELSKFRKDFLTRNYKGTRFLTVGWEPESLAQINQGALDDYLEGYFRDSIDPNKSFGISDPIWFRPMCEFNSGWVPWGHKPLDFRKAWRRMFNIAEQVGATQRHIFVWSPNSLSFPNKEWNAIKNYYPGDQYVDWVGASVYPHNPSLVNVATEQFPSGNVAEVYDAYADRKPIMISEGGYDKRVDRARWVREWFEKIKAERPKIRAIIWENHNDRSLSIDAKSLEAYREQVSDPYWISETGNQ